MADEAGLVFALDARINKMERALARAEARAASAGKRIETEFRRTNQKVTDGLTKSATGMARLGQVTGAQRFVIQNTANQFGDLAVQIAGGTSVMRAMSQQTPQLLGGFAALGGTLGTLGPIMGVVAAVGLPLAAVLFNMATGSEEAAKKAETLEDKVKNLTGAVSDYTEAADLALKGTADLADEYGRFAKEAQLALDVQERLQRNAAQQKLDEAAAGFTSRFGSLDFGAPEGDALAVPGLSEYEQTLRSLREDMKLTADQALLLVQALFAVRRAEGPQEQLEAFKALRETLVSIHGSLEAANTATGGFVDQINTAILDAAKLQSAVEEVASASNLIAAAMRSADGAIAAAANTASSLAGAMREAALDAWDYVGALGAAANRQAAEVGGGRGLDPRKFVDDPYWRDRFFPRPQNAPASRPARGGRGGAGSNINAQEAADLAKAKALYESTRTAAERYAAELAEINRLKAEGHLTDEVYQRSLDQIKEKLGDLDGAAASAANAVKSAFTGLFDDPKQALEDLAKQLFQLALFKQLATSLPGVFGAGGIIPLIPGFASGGYHSGGLRIVGENGPELEATGPSRIIPTEAFRRMGSGAAPIVIVENNSGQPSSQQSSRGPDGRAMVRVVVGEELARGSFDKPMAGRFQARPQPVKR